MFRRVQESLSKLVAGHENRRAKKTWEAGIGHELGFWDDWMKNRGGQWADRFQLRCDPNTELQPEITEELRLQPGSTIDILDVGAGPMTFLGKRWQDHTLRIVAIDPLATEYDRLLAKYSQVPLVRTKLGHAETLSKQFAPNSFDLITACNCLDHSYDPVHAIRQMVTLIKPDGIVYLRHFVNEAETQLYQGLHQWNFFDRDGHFCIGSKQKVVDVTAELAPLATVRNKFTEDGKSIMNIIRRLT